MNLSATTKASYMNFFGRFLREKYLVKTSFLQREKPYYLVFILRILIFVCIRHIAKFCEAMISNHQTQNNAYQLHQKFSKEKICMLNKPP